ncbi:hypothetical protein [Actomonas aquatica]|uniref:Xylose isomerase n=1 Tax=Actomonas aquatica TaxID=2866162 RepID=A0ABZ1CDE6_9BACT|nr:hypothetical protein [Opitutus sp. WL0086]WRQ89584.1 hypothetical protein K1X11_009200 [Opitutus sp. WL0086]
MKFHSTPSEPRYCATLWTLDRHPTATAEWSIEEKLTAIATAGFDGVHDLLQPRHLAFARSLKLAVIGRLDGRFADTWQPSLHTQIDHGVTLFNTHLGLHDTPPATAAAWAAAMFTEGQRLGARVQFETHRDTATETPEKYNALNQEFTRLTGEPLPTTWDHSHFAVMKHLQPEDYASRLLAWPNEIQASHLFHCRPFNGQHAQVPVTDHHGKLTLEFHDYQRFTADLFTLWREGPTPRPALWICPEMGPGSAGYHLSTHSSPWTDAQRCRLELARQWQSATQSTDSETIRPLGA